MSISSRNEKDELACIQEVTDYAVKRAEHGSIVALFFNCLLSSVYQPVFNEKTRDVIGHAAFIRSALNGVAKQPATRGRPRRFGTPGAILTRQDHNEYF